MSSNHHEVDKIKKHRPTFGQIDHVNFLSNNIGSLFMDDQYSDVILKLEDTTIPAHKVILAANSQYFKALLYGGMLESTQREVEIKDTNPESFKILLKYVYTGQMTLTNMSDDTVLELLALAHQYCFGDLEAAISDYLRGVLTVDSCCPIYDCARLYNLPFLKHVTAMFIDHHAKKIIFSDAFSHLSAESLKEIVSRDSFYSSEADIFQALCLWMNSNSDVPREVIKDLFTVVRLPLMSLKELLTVVRPACVISSDEILNAIAAQIGESPQLPCNQRGTLRPEENVALSVCGATVVQGEMKSALLNGDNHNYDLEQGYTRHTISSDLSSNCGIVIKLGTPCIINHIKMLLWDKDLRSYSYLVDVSINENDWTRVIDYSQYYCRSWQFLYFDARVVRYIRITGTNNTANKIFHIVSIEIMFTNRQITLEDGIIVPKNNVATLPNSATVIEGVCRTRYSLLDGNTKVYDWDSGYTCHQLGSGNILVQLGQPYMLDSMRLLLWDCDDRSYGYIIETSVNSKDWEIAVDKSKEYCQSWQNLHFSKRVVVFIRIKGTMNTANEVFHCVHLECPAQLEESATSQVSKSTAIEIMG